MPYSSVASLPAPVRAKLKGKKLRQWLHVFNSSYSRNQSESIAFAEAWATVKKAEGFGKAKTMNDFNFFLPIAKVDQDKRTVSGYASTPTKDADGEIVTLDAVRNALPDYMAWGNIREMHKLSAVGTAEEANVDTKGLFLTAKIVDDSAWKKCLEGVYKGFSIGGRKLAKTGDKITEIDLTEISVVDRPANPDAKFNLAKSAKSREDEPGYLVKVKIKPSAEGRALAKMAKIVEGLAKAGPPAAHDGFSLPAASRPDGEPSPNDSRPNENVTRKSDDDVKCEKHGVVGCEKCSIEKRDFDAAARRSAAASGAAMPDGSFPVHNEEDLGNAVRLVGHGKNPAKAKDHIKNRARALGLESALPDEWKTSKKAKKAAKAELAKILGLRSDSFLSLKKTEARREASAENLEKSLAGLDLAKSDDVPLTPILGEDLNMTKVAETNGGTGDAIADALSTMMKRAAQPTKAMRMAMANEDVKKSRKACKAARGAIEEAHKMHKAAYLNKAKKAGGKEPDGEGEFDHAGAMSKLQKAYQEIDKARTFGKAAQAQIAKASGRSGQSGQEVSDSDAHYEVPPGVKDLSPSAMAGASPGGEGSGGRPPAYPDDGSVYPGKAAVGGDLAKYAKNGQIPADVAELLMAKTKAEGELEALRRMPSAGAGGRRPYAFDMQKVTGSTGTGTASSDTINKALFEGVDPVALGSNDEMAHTAASAKVIGNFLTSGHFGKSVFDPAFKGAAGNGR